MFLAAMCVYCAVKHLLLSFRRANDDVLCFHCFSFFVFIINFHKF